jgi:electron transfer flavoprotein beta subunit
VVSVVKGVNEPRYPSLKGIMAAKRKEIKKMGIGDLQVSAGSVGLDGSKTKVLAATARQERTAGEVLKPESPEDAAKAIADWLQSRKLI